MPLTCGLSCKQGTNEMEKEPVYLPDDSTLRTETVMM